jgi:hypothetical protein
MLGFISRFGAAKGMVVVPNFSGVTTATAQSQIVSAGLKVSSISGIRNTNVLAENGVSLSQLPIAGTLVDYETEVVITSGNYVEDTVTVSPCQGYTTPVNDPDYCSGTLYVYGPTRTKNRKTVTTTNNVTVTSTTTYDYSCADTVVPRGSEYINGQCGHVVAPVTCTPTANVTYSTCTAAFIRGSSGRQTKTTSGIDSACNPYSNSVSYTCFQPMCDPYGPWSTLPTDSNKEQRGQNCQTADGTFYQNRQVRCKTTYVTTYGGCGSKGTKVRTIKTYVCGIFQSTSSSSIPCNLF